MKIFFVHGWLLVRDKGSGKVGFASLFEGLQPEGTQNKPVLTPLMADVFQLSCYVCHQWASKPSVWSCPQFPSGVVHCYGGSREGSLSIHGRQWVEERVVEVTCSWRLVFQSRGEIAIWGWVASLGGKPHQDRFAEGSSILGAGRGGLRNCSGREAGWNIVLDAMRWDGSSELVRSGMFTGWGGLGLFNWPFCPWVSDGQASWPKTIGATPFFPLILNLPWA